MLSFHPERYYVVDGTDCWQQCDQHGGACPQHCGPTGYCCSSTRHHVNGDCTVEMEEAIRNTFVLLESQRKCAPSGTYRNGQTVLSMILIHIP